MGLNAQALPRGQRIGVFGGSFDPPHNAHVALARSALDQFQLDSLHVVPTGLAWHKSRALSAPVHRLAMTRLAFDDVARGVVDDRELQREGPTFTIDTLRALQTENPQAQIYLFMGTDQFVAFRQWHQWQEILEIAIICIADRAESTPTQTQFDAYGAQSHRFFALKLPWMLVSATQVRQLIASGAACDIATLVPEPVARYIALHQLYAPR
ncbi:nicotinate-nucleotide adenylyltransferase [Polaromonas sp. CG_9.5]|uniref:nicotinate (nicotinamide) nucleotide adenylyltransferase n=1 Tax=Polaromonas sp. CG_9.5 TaxID=3071705 RepID=UPI002DFEA6A8|nr:nicotinate-nucleotide adenylyltransferase [Polaromonas sp. CG_9.5]